MLRHYYAKLGLPDDDAKQKGAGDRDDDKDDGFPEVHNAFMIFGGPSMSPYGTPAKEGTPRGLLGQGGHSPIPRLVSGGDHL